MTFLWAEVLYINKWFSFLFFFLLTFLLGVVGEEELVPLVQLQSLWVLDSAEDINSWFWRLSSKSNKAMPEYWETLHDIKFLKLVVFFCFYFAWASWACWVALDNVSTKLLENIYKIVIFCFQKTVFSVKLAYTFIIGPGRNCYLLHWWQRQNSLIHLVCYRMLEEHKNDASYSRRWSAERIIIF